MIGFDRVVRILFPVMWQVEGSSSLSTRGYAGARSVLTSAGRELCSSARIKPANSREIPFPRNEDADALAELVCVESVSSVSQTRGSTVTACVR